MAFPQELHDAIRAGLPVTPIDRFDAANRERLSGPGLRTFLNIAAEWELSEQEKLRVLGMPARSTFHKWARQARAHEPITLSVDVLVRISAVLGIHKALRILHGSPQRGVEWLKTPNRSLLFGGQRPIDLVTSGAQDGLLLVRRYLDAQRGGMGSPPTPAPFEGEPWRPEDIIIDE